ESVYAERFVLRGIIDVGESRDVQRRILAAAGRLVRRVGAVRPLRGGARGAAEPGDDRHKRREGASSHAPGDIVPGVYTSSTSPPMRSAFAALMILVCSGFGT